MLPLCIIKSILELSQVMEFLRFTMDTVMMEIKLPSDRVLKIGKGGSGFSQIMSTVNWENECHFSGNFPSSFVLPTFTGRDVDAQLTVWHISGIDSEVRTFRKRLLLSCSNHGGQKPTSLTTHSLGGGLTGVIEGVQCGKFSCPPTQRRL